MKEEYKDFIGIYDETIPIELCNEFVDNWEEAKKNETIIDLTKENELGLQEEYSPGLQKKHGVAYILPLMCSMYPKPPVQKYFKLLRECFLCYIERYSIDFDGTIYNDVFKIHKVGKSEGFHQWHYEKSDHSTMDRLMVYMTYLEVPEKGGETEFLHQSLRIDPIVGRTLIWPAGYTHMHRGNPPLDGEKMYITGWFTGERKYGNECNEI